MSSAGTTLRRVERVGPARRGARPLVLLIALLVGALWAGDSRAQATDNSGIDFTPSTGVDRVQEAYTQARPWWISRADCIANDVFTFSLGVDDPSDPIEIWVGTDNCVDRRNSEDLGQCWIVAKDASGNDRPVIDVPVRNVVARRRGTSDPPSGLPESVCDESDDRSGEQLTFYFMVVDGGQAVTSTTWNASDTGGTGFDTLGPQPPTSIDVGVGERQLSIGVDNTREDTDLRRFEAFCVPAGTPGPPPVVPAQTTMTLGDGGTSTTNSGASNPAPEECFTPILAGGARPPSGFSCGVVSKDARIIQTGQLDNLQAYAVGVAGQDLMGNAGVVSDIQCGTPIPLNDFFEMYNENGGPGGGGFCNLSPSSNGGSGQPVAWLGLLFGGLLWRRMRSRA